MVGLGKPPTDSTHPPARDGQLLRAALRLSAAAVARHRRRVLRPQPELAAEVANAVADAFVELQQDAKRQSAVAATDWLQQEIERLRARVAEAEQAVADYRSKHGLFDVDQSTSAARAPAPAPATDLSTQQLGDINAELARAAGGARRGGSAGRLVQKLLDEGGSLDASEEVLNSQLIQRLRERQVALQAQIADLSTTLLPTHPRIRALQEQVANLDEQIRDEAKKVLASLQTAARVAAAREESLLKSLNEAKADVSRSNDRRSSCARWSAKRRRSATCLNRSSRAIAKRRRAPMPTICRPMRASSRTPCRRRAVLPEEDA